jgi:hypothetical protein
MLVDQATEHVSSMNAAFSALVYEQQSGGWIRRFELQRLVRSVPVVVLDIDSQDLFQVPATHRVGEGWPVVPGGQVGLDGLQGGVAGRHGCPTVAIGRRQGGVVKALARHRSRTASSATVGTRMATSSLARRSRASRRQSRRSVLTLSPGALGINVGAITSQRTSKRSSRRASS